MRIRLNRKELFLLEQIRRDHGLSDREFREASKYLRGPQQCMQYDRLSADVRHAVDVHGKKLHELFAWEAQHTLSIVQLYRLRDALDLFIDQGKVKLD